MRHWYVLLLLFLPGALAGWYHPGDAITTDDTYTMDQVGDGVFFTSENDSFLVPEGTCKQHGWYKYCLKEIEEDLNASHVEFENGTFKPALRVSANKNGPDFTVDRSFNESPLRVGEPVLVEATVKNTGDIEADFIYRDDLPSVLDVPGRTGSFVTSAGLDTGESTMFNYTVVPRDYTRGVANATVWYGFEGLNGTSVDSDVVAVYKPFNISVSFPGRVKIGENVTFNVSVSAAERVDVRIRHSASMPLLDGRTVYDEPVNDTYAVGNVYKPLPGMNHVFMNASVTWNDTTYTMGETRGVNVSFTPLRINATVSEEVVNEGGNVTVKLPRVTEPQRYTVQGVHVTFLNTSEHTNESVDAVRMDVPRVDQVRNASIGVVSEYTVGGFSFETSDTASVAVHPVPPNLSVTLRTPDTVYEDENASVEAVVSNDASVPVTVNVSFPGVTRRVTIPAYDVKRVNASLPASNHSSVVVRSGDSVVRDEARIRVEERERSRERASEALSVRDMLGGLVDAVVWLFTGGS